MPYDAAIADRIRALLPPGRAFQEKVMFGGLAFLLGGRMCAGAVGERIVLYLGRDAASAAIATHPAAAPMDFTGRVMHNFIYLDPQAVPDDAELRLWLERAISAVT